MCLAIQTSISAMDFEDLDGAVGNTGHIATAFLMISEVPADEGSEFIVTVQKDACNL